MERADSRGGDRRSAVAHGGERAEPACAGDGAPQGATCPQDDVSAGRLGPVAGVEDVVVRVLRVDGDVVVRRQGQAAAQRCLTSQVCSGCASASAATSGRPSTAQHRSTEPLVQTANTGPSTGSPWPGRPATSRAPRAAATRIGDPLVDALCASARAEVQAYAAQVSEWERRRGFEHR